MRTLYILLLALLFGGSITAQPTRRKVAPTLGAYEWQMLNAKGRVEGRHECSFVEYDGLFYLLGGRGVHSVGIYDPVKNRWSKGAKSPIEINHFQAVVYGEDIYMVGAMNGAYPTEKPLENVWIYRPASDEWIQGDEIPAEFRRGGAGSVAYDGIIYSACGIEYGHTSGTTNLFNSYNPATGEWRRLTASPHLRDHFAAVVHEGKLYCIGGRNSSVHFPEDFGAFFGCVVPQVDVYDFESATWNTLPEPLPVPTAAAGVAAFGKNIVYVGGEGPAPLAYDNTQCLDTQTGKWSSLAPMAEGMHGSGLIFYQGEFFWAAGSYKKGGSDMKSIQRFSLRNK